MGKTADSETLDKRGGSRRGRHAAVRKHRHVGVVLAILIPFAVIVSAGCAAWFVPSDMMPFPKATSTCQVDGGGTLVVDTDCGSFLYRGHADVMRDMEYKVTHTGPVAWEFELED